MNTMNKIKKLVIGIIFSLMLVQTGSLAFAEGGSTGFNATDNPSDYVKYALKNTVDEKSPTRYIIAAIGAISFFGCVFGIFINFFKKEYKYALYSLVGAAVSLQLVMIITGFSETIGK